MQRIAHFFGRYRTFRSSLFGRISIVYLVLLFVACAFNLLIWLTSFGRFSDYSEQFLNWQLAADLEHELRDVLQEPLDFAEINQRIYELSNINPNIDIYVLSHDGHIIATLNASARNAIDVRPIQEFLSFRSLPDTPIYGDDPRHSQYSPLRSTVIFSAAPTTVGRRPGFLYVTLRGEQRRHIYTVLGERELQRVAFMWVPLTVLIAALLGIALFRGITRRFSKVTKTVEEFASGRYERRVEAAADDEIGTLAKTFNHMAATIQSNIQNLEDNDMLRRTLVANVSHDLRGPLTCVHGFLQMLELEYGGQFESAARRYLEVIEKNIGHLRKLADSLFELSKLEARESAPSLERFSLEELCGDLVLKFLPLAQDRGVTLETESSCDSSDVEADIMLIERALSNLIDNALRYTPKGGRITLRLQPDGARIRVRVEDTGKGIPAADLPYLFERFYRVEKHRSKKEGGAGLGLAIVRKVLEAHGETITVESELGTGTVFQLTLTAAPSHSAAAASQPT